MSNSGIMFGAKVPTLWLDYVTGQGVTDDGAAAHRSGPEEPEPDRHARHGPQLRGQADHAHREGSYAQERRARRAPGADARLEGARQRAPGQRSRRGPVPASADRAHRGCTPGVGVVRGRAFPEGSALGVAGDRGRRANHQPASEPAQLPEPYRPEPVVVVAAGRARQEQADSGSAARLAGHRGRSAPHEQPAARRAPGGRAELQ